MRPKSERDCQFCREEKGKRTTSQREKPVSCQLRKGRGGRKKKVPTEGCFCPNKAYAYYGITEEAIHPLVGDGSHGTQEIIRDLKCQACGKEFTGNAKTVQIAYHQARDLCQKTGDTTHLFAVLLGLRRFALMRGGVQEACELSSLMLELARSRENRSEEARALVIARSQGSRS